MLLEFEPVIAKLLNICFDAVGLIKNVKTVDDCLVFSLDEIEKVSIAVGLSGTQGGVDKFCERLRLKDDSIVLVQVAAAFRLVLNNCEVAKTIEETLYKICRRINSGSTSKAFEKAQVKVFEDLQAYFVRHNLEERERDLCNLFGDPNVTGGNVSQSIARFQRIKVPDYWDYFQRQHIEINVLERIQELCSNPQKGALLITGCGGIGKSTLLSYLLNSEQYESFFLENCKVKLAVWLNCFTWKDTFDEADFNETVAVAISGKKLPVQSEPPHRQALQDAFSTIGANNLLVVLDNVYINIELLAYFRKQCPSVACCVLTRESMQIDSWQKSSLGAIPLIRHPPCVIPYLEVDEIKGILSKVKSTSQLEGFLGSQKLDELAKSCYGLQLIVSFIPNFFTFCSDKFDYGSQYYELMKILKSDSLSKTMSKMFQFAIERLDKSGRPRLRNMYFAVLFFNPVEIISPKDFTVLWGLKSQNDALLYCKKYEQQSLLRKVRVSTMTFGQQVDRGNLEDAAFTVHELVHEAALQLAASMLLEPDLSNTKRLQSMRKKIASGFCFKRSQPISPTTVIIDSTIQQKNWELLEKIVDQIDDDILAEFYDLTGGQTFLHRLCIAQWNDEIITNGGLRGSNLFNYSNQRLLNKLFLKMHLSNVDIAPFPNRKYPTGKLFWFETWVEFAGLREFAMNFMAAEIFDAACHGFTEIVKDKITKIPGIANRRDEIGMTTLHHAAQAGYLDIVQYLVLSSPGLVTTVDYMFKRAPICWAAELGRTEVVTFLGQTNPETITMVDRYGMTPIILASLNGKTETVKILFELSPSSVEMRDNDGGFPLHWAAFNGHTQTAEFLAKKDPGALKRHDRYYGLTPLSSAVANSHKETVKTLYKMCPEAIKISAGKGNSPKVYFSSTAPQMKTKMEAKLVDSSKKTPLIFAAMTNDLELVTFLSREFSEAATLQDDNGFTPLACAVICGHRKIVKFFIDNYPEALTIKDKQERTPLDLAKEFVNDEILIKLLSGEAMDQNDWNGDSRSSYTVKIPPRVGQVEHSKRKV